MVVPRPGQLRSPSPASLRSSHFTVLRPATARLGRAVMGSAAHCSALQKRRPLLGLAPAPALRARLAGFSPAAGRAAGERTGKPSA